MVRVLVTGGSGFIGHHLISFLSDQGYWVRGVDLNPPPFIGSRANEFEVMDLRSLPECLRATENVDEIYAMVSDASADDGEFGSAATASHNRNLINSQSIDAARQNGVRRFLYASSERVYPEGKRAGGVPLREEDAQDPAEPDAKGRADLVCERQCLEYAEKYGMETRIVRIHDVYGPLAPWFGGKETLVSALCRRVAAAQVEGLHEIEITGDGKSRGSYLYIDDCVAGLHNIMRSNCRKPVNLDHPRILSVRELANLIARIAGAEISPCLSSSAEDIRCCKFETTLLEETVRWKPDISLEEGIKRTYQWVATQVRELASEFSFGIAHFPKSR